MHIGNINNLFTLLFSRSTKKFTVFLSKISLDKICTEKLHQNHSNSSKYAFKLLLENNNKISFFFILSFQPSAAQLSQARSPSSQPQRGPARQQHAAWPAAPARPSSPAARALGFHPSAAASRLFVISDGCPVISPDQKGS